MATAMSVAQKEQAITQIANVSRLLRDAIQAALPTSPEQYLTVTIPGTSIDVRDITDGGTYVYGKEYSAFVPPAVRQAEARLVDGMMPLAHVAIGATGKSVSRSYSRALDTLVARRADVQTGQGNIRSPGDDTYKNAMSFLTKPDNSGKTPVDIYIQKQAAWASSQSDWDRAKLKAQANAKIAYPDDLVKQRQEYDEWNQAHFRKYKFAVQGRYMDWVANGHKYDVESNFGIVDLDSIMSRIELSKESLRNSVLVDVDGANELAGVILEPKDWATKCRMKALGWYKRNKDWSLDQIDAEITRLQRLKISYQALIAQIDAGTYPIAKGSGAAASTDTAETKTTAANTLLQTAFTNLYSAEAELNRLNVNIRNAADQPARDTIKNSDEYKTALTTLVTRRRELNAANEANTKTLAQISRDRVNNLDAEGKARVKTWISAQEGIIDDQVDRLQKNRDLKSGQQGPGVPVITDAEADEDHNGTIVAGKDAALADPKFLLDPTVQDPATADSLPEGGTTSDPWTEISVAFSAEDQNNTTTTSSWGMSVGGSGGWGLWSAGGSYAHDESKSDTVSDMAKCNVSVTFSALVVNINRPWLYGELFADDELDVATGWNLSPGAQKLHDLMMNQKGSGSASTSNPGVVKELAKYGTFPAYPTSFVLAADTVVEFQGDTQHIENHFSQHSNSGSAHFGWGPWSVSSSFHESASSSQFQMQSTATGCRLSFGAPQVIGWVSQILPQLPRDPNYSSMVQNVISS